MLFTNFLPPGASSGRCASGKRHLARYSLAWISAFASIRVRRRRLDHDLAKGVPDAAVVQLPLSVDESAERVRGQKYGFGEVVARRRDFTWVVRTQRLTLVSYSHRASAKKRFQ